MLKFTTETSAPAIIIFRADLHRNTLNRIRVQRPCVAVGDPLAKTINAAAAGSR
jgi:hypothetical protein